jgi:hypothetical protein
MLRIQNPSKPKLMKIGKKTPIHQFDDKPAIITRFQNSSANSDSPKSNRHRPKIKTSNFQNTRLASANRPMDFPKERSDGSGVATLVEVVGVRWNFEARVSFFAMK